MRRIIGISSLSTLSLAALVLPSLVSALGVLDTLYTISRILNGLVGIIVTIAIIVFFWGLVRYLTDVGEAKQEGLKTMFYGVIAIFVMVSIWGIIHLVQNTFGVGGQNTAIIPQGIIVPPGN